MTEKILNALAAALARSKPDGHYLHANANKAALDQWKLDVDTVEDVAIALNPRFKTEKWRKACGLTYTATNE
jgi:uncharacterized membrane-anchored protein